MPGLEVTRWRARKERKWEVGNAGWGPTTSNLKHLMTRETEQRGVRPGQGPEDAGLGRAVGDLF